MRNSIMPVASINQSLRPDDARVRLSVDGLQIFAEKGMSVAAAIEATGRHEFSRGIKGEGRGLFCGMGACHDCLVTIDGKVSQRACMTIVDDDMQVLRPAARPDLATGQIADLCSVPHSLTTRTMDVLIVGAGPAGLAAAEVLAAAGAKVTVIDERPSAGGQYFKQPSTRNAAERLSGDEQALSGAALIGQVRDHGVTFLSATVVWGAARDDDGSLIIACYGSGHAFYCKPKILIIATGAYERPTPVRGWTLPGAMTTGAAQTLLRSYGTVPGRRIVIAGNGPLNMQVANELRKAGASIVALLEAAPPPWSRPAAAFGLLTTDPALARHGLRQISTLRSACVKIDWNSVLTSINGSQRVESVTFAGPDGETNLDADTVLIGGNFTSSNELSRLLGCGHEVVGGDLRAVRDLDGQTTLANVHIVGEAARFGGAHVAMAEGQIAAAAIARKLGLLVQTDESPVKRLARHRRFQEALWQVFAPKDDAKTKTAILPDDALICRCEGVTYGVLRTLSADSARDISTLKRLSRAGMGRCQSRYCGKAIADVAKERHLAGETSGFLAPQMPLRPIPLAALAVEKPEWGGHKRALLPEKPALANPQALPVVETSTLVIGAGIAGLSTALFLAREGEDVVVVERTFANSLASGGNAGSLHAQLLSFDHGARAEGGAGAAAQTLPLQRDSIALWAALQSELGQDFEMKVTGGLMVAETDDHMRFLAEKVGVECAAGIDCRLIGQEELRSLEPALSSHFVGAAYCSQEGKINPLVATQYILEAARRDGAQLFENCEVTEIRTSDDGFEVKTSRGMLRAKRIVNAAGAFASRIGAMLGVDVPVFGAPLQMVVTEAAAPLISCLVAHADRHLTLKQAANGNFIIGGGWTAGLDPVHQHPRPLLSSLEGNLWVAQHVVPALRKLHLIRSWAAMNINIDGAPILGEHPSMPGFFNAVTSNGYTLGPIVGQLTSRLILGRETDRALQPFSIARFQKGRA
ncbi:FAD-dependent oxidoreductase [Rhizobium indigoferae]|uniref:FAD-dependent oxidoreductase n=4 Tax=Rhizobium TaxID=379 RepID=A0ABZ0ZHN1_9HYPH|nr:FAD-dependent oxidoreductase [Rhizobium indigoferae]NNU54429.1 FAD-dependent oxidoreductase [Rhizobium indigoferae]WQN38939.1 FAD-dependent oxidoreductase [Rhizobium indigoferae]